jgi:DegV family protein with EDD domain
MKIAIVTDSTCDLRHLEGTAIVPLYVNFQGSMKKDWEEITPSQIFDGIKQGADLPSTSQPTPQDFKNAFEAALATSDHVLAILVSSGLSGTVGSANLAAQDYPGKVTIFDSLNTCSGLGMMVLRANEMLQAGNSLDGVLVELARIRDDFKFTFTVANLDMLKRNGRIGGAQALLGGLLGIKPLLTLVNGRVETKGRARGEKKALAEIIEGFRVWAEGRENIRVFYIYSVDAGAVSPLVEGVNALGLPIEQSHKYELGAVVASHVGPGTYGLFAFSH